jgi:hypothetical protein
MPVHFSCCADNCVVHTIRPTLDVYIPLVPADMRSNLYRCRFDASEICDLQLQSSEYLSGTQVGQSTGNVTSRLKGPLAACISANMTHDGGPALVVTITSFRRATFGSSYVTMHPTLLLLQSDEGGLNMGFWGLRLYQSCLVGSHNTIIAQLSPIRAPVLKVVLQ